MAASDPFAIWGRVVESSWTRLPAGEARAILRLRFKKPEKERVRKLSQLAREGTITPRERQELYNYLYVGRLLTIMHSGARRSLKSSKDAGVARRRAS